MRSRRLGVYVILLTVIVAGLLGLLVANFSDSGEVKNDTKVETALRALVSECRVHGSIQSYSFRYQTTNYLWTAICKDGTPVVVGGD